MVNRRRAASGYPIDRQRPRATRTAWRRFRHERSVRQTRTRGSAGLIVVRPVGRASAATAGSRQHRGFALALEFGDLVAQDEDLGVLGAVRAAELCCLILLPIDPASWATITMAVCQRCGGRGRVPWVCVRCNGTGSWWAQPVYGMFTAEYTCLLCHGRGRGEEGCGIGRRIRRGA